MTEESGDKIQIFCPKDWQDYELLDTGEGEKLERVGKYFFVRPCEDAIWAKTLSKKYWENIDGRFFTSKQKEKSGWKFYKNFKQGNKIDISYKDIKFLVTPTPFRHYGFFPEQAVHWDFIEEKIKNAKKNSQSVRFLNLFGYTGIASLSAVRAGAEATHVDASSQSVDWLRENQKVSGMADLPLRVIVDDTLKFLAREEKRGAKYDAVIMDPPKFGRGPKGETWKIEEHLPKLLSQIRKILSDKPLFVILNSYATDSSSLMIGYALKDAMRDLEGQTIQGELCLQEKSNGRTIPLSNTTIWFDKDI